MARKKTEPGANLCLAANLSALLDRQGVSNARLSRWLGVSREIVGQWRHGEVRPTPQHFGALCAALQCSQDDLLTSHARPVEDMLPIAAWARREGIPCQRARDLFTLRILTGEYMTPYAIFVPIGIRAPEDSKTRVVMAKRRPRWVSVFQANFARIVTLGKLNYTTIGLELGVQSSAVSHWVKGRNYPDKRRLPEIASVLGVPMQALIGDMRL